MAPIHPARRCRRAAFRGAAAHALGLTGLSFVAHFVWEQIQCPLLFEHLSYDGSWRGMVVATLGDVGLTWAIYATVALVSRRWRWTRHRWGALQLLTLAFTAVGLAVAIELRGLHAGRWRYVGQATVVPGLGVSFVPILQLLVLTPLLLAAAERLTAGPRAAPSHPPPPAEP